MASDQNQNQTVSGGDTRPPSTLPEINEERLRKKIEAGRKIAEQNGSEKLSDVKTETVLPQASKVETPASAPSPETAPDSDDALASLAESQRGKTEVAMEKQDQAATKLSEIKEEVGDAQEEADRAARKVIGDAKLAELRVERDAGGRSIESARRAELQAEKAEGATEDLLESAKAAAKQENVVEKATAQANIEIKKFKKIKNAFDQKKALEEWKRLQGIGNKQ